MKKLIELGNNYAKNSDWKDFALTKFCLFSMGIFAGTYIAEGGKSLARWIAVVVFLITYVILMKKVIQIWKRMK